MVSIILINYKTKNELFACIDSIFASKTKVSLEIIVVNNDEKKKISEDLKKRFPQVIYISNENKGYGQGNNVGFKHSAGDYLLFLNPDTLVMSGMIDELHKYINRNAKVGVVSPLLLASDLKPSDVVGSVHYTVLNAIFSLTFVHKLFPNNLISNKFFLKDWDRKKIKQVDVVPGTALMISKELFDRVGGFDENFFLFFEEADLCKRINKLGYKNFIIPEAKVVHIGKVSTKKRNDINEIFAKSRFYYFKKWHGLIIALFLELFFRFKKEHLIIGLICTLSLFLGLYRLSETMPFIGDQGWFYLSARDLVREGNVPMVGIASSRTWLHQGAFWTYILSLMLWLFNFNPLSGAVFTVLLGVATVFLVYKVGNDLFSQMTGLIAAFFYTTSPLFIENSRFAYHTSPIPFFTILFIGAVYAFVRGNKFFLPLCILLLTILYNFELATFSYVICFISILGYGIFTNQKWAKQALEIKIVFLSIMAFLIPMLPMLIYDFQNGFPQTVKFLGWGVFEIIGFFDIFKNEVDSTTWVSFFSSNIELIKNIFLPISSVFSLIIFISIFVVFIYAILSENNNRMQKLLVHFLFVVPLIGFIMLKTNSGAYTLIFFPTLALIFGVVAVYISRFKTLKIPVYLFIVFIGLINSSYFIWKLHADGYNFSQRIVVSKDIIKSAAQKNYNIIGAGEGSEFESFTMNYEYLTWWMGHGPSDKEEKLKYYITELPGKVLLIKRQE